MKKLIFTFLSFCLIYSQANSQACTGTHVSGPSICDTNSLITAPGLAPTSAELGPAFNGSSCVVVIQFENYDTLTFAGQNVEVNSLTVNSIDNLPKGMCWATNSSTNTYTTSEKGCIAVFFDTLAATPGQYELGINVSANTVQLGNVQGISAAAAGLYYYVRVINPTDTLPAIDTTGEAHATLDTIYTTGYSSTINTAIAACDTGEVASIHEVALGINRLSVNPNPFTQTAMVYFNSIKNAPLTEKLTDILGRTIWSRPIEVKLGLNQSKIDREALPSGIYFYSVGDGQSSANLKVIAE